MRQKNLNIKNKKKNGQNSTFKMRQNSKCDKTKKKMKMWQNLKTQNVTKLENSDNSSH